MRIKDRAGMALFSVIGIGLLFLVSSCIEAPEDNTTSDTSGPLVICDNVFSLNPGSLYRVQTNGLGLTKLAANLNVPWEAYVDPESGDLYFTEDGTGDCSGSVKRIQNP
ncbi:MAG TPA: hypothetical protein VLB09_06625, partial [Nitrospiria bacterium]|nr:hypothetical protein [Nitrospiria bacterium]